jgi:biotin operon repressor
MSLRLMVRVFQLDIPPSNKLVLLAMAEHANGEGSSCYPSIGTLMKETSLSRRSVQTVIRQLEKAGLLVRIGKARGGRSVTTEYSLSLEKPTVRTSATPTPFRGKKRVRNSAARAPFPKPKRAQNLHEKGAKFDQNRECILIEPKTEPGGALTFVGKSVEEASPNTPPKNIAATVHAFLAFNFDRPFGHPRFQEAVLRHSAEIKNGNQLEAMENVIVELGGKVPPLWYAAKHALEETLQSAAVRSEAQVGSPRQSRAAEPFSRDEIEKYCARNVAKLQRAADKFPAIAERLREVAKTLRDLSAAVCRAEHIDLESLERELTVLEETLFALVKREATEEQLSRVRREVDRCLKSFSTKLTSEQRSRVENQYLQKRLLEEFGIPRLGLFYLA